MLFEGEEIELRSALKLKLGNIQGEPAIELCGSDPSKFGVLRKVGLINEQINWKQRFFVPTEEEPGIAILAALLEQFPVIAPEDDEADSDVVPDLAMRSATTLEPIDLETWIIDTAESHRMNDDERQQPLERKESENEPTSDEFGPTCTYLSQSTFLPLVRQASAAATPPAAIRQQHPNDSNRLQFRRKRVLTQDSLLDVAQQGYNQYPLDPRLQCEEVAYTALSTCSLPCRRRSIGLLGLAVFLE